MTWDIAGFPNNYMRPAYVAQINFATGPQANQGALNVLLLGMKSSAGNLIADTEIRQVSSYADCRTAAGAGSQLARMGIAALKALARYGGNVNVFMAAVLEATGTQATVTMALSGTWTTNGQFTTTIAGVPIVTSVSSTDTATTAAANIAASVNAQPDCPFTASATTGTVTLTCVNKGLQGKNWVIYQDLSLAPSGLVSAITGSASVNTAGPVSGVFAGATATGTGAESYTNIITKIGTRRYARIGVGANDATNAAALLAFGQAQAAPTVQLYDQFVYGFNGSSASAQTLANTTLNDPRSNLFAMRNSETHPAEIAAGWAAVRAAVESADFTSVTQGIGPIPDYDSYDCSAWIAPQRGQFQDSWLPSEENTLLNNGVTPISTYGGKATCVRGITTYCLLGGVQDTRCLDIGDAAFPDYVVYDLQAVWQSFRAANKLVQDNNPPQQNEPPRGVAYPNLWASKVRKRLADYRDAGCIPDTFSPPSPSLPVSAVFNSSARRIQSNVPFIVNRVQHQIGVIVDQAAPS